MRKKRSVGVFLIITALVIMLLPVSEADAASSASDFVIKSGKLTKYKGTEKVVTIPDTVEVIGENAFGQNKTVEKVIFSDAVHSVEAYSFWGCDNLKTIQLGKGMTLIDDCAFTNCGGLESMIIPSNVRYIGIQAFSYCENLEDITIPPSVIDIAEDAFEGDYLLNIHCETGSYADKYAQDFYERQKKMSVYGTPEQVESVPPQTGTELTVPGITDSGSGESGTGNAATEHFGAELGSTKVVANQAVVFMQSARIPGAGGQSAGTGADGMQTGAGTDRLEGQTPSWCVPERAFYRNNQLKEEAVADEVREIAPFAYARSSVSGLRLPGGLERIDFAAFYHCDDLEEVSLPESVTSVAAKAFGHTPWVERFQEGADGTEGDFLISGGVLVSYRGEAEEVVIPEGVRVIAGDAFEGHAEIKKVIFPDSLQVIDKDAFKDCNPESAEYKGNMLEQSLVEQLVVMSGKSAAPAPQSMPIRWNWILAACVMLTGTMLTLGKARL